MKAFTLLLVIGSMAGTAAFAQSPTAPDTSEIKLVKVGLQRVPDRGPVSRAVPRTDPGSQQRQRTAQQQSDPDRNPSLHRLSQNAEVASEYNPNGPDGPTSPPMKFVASIVVKNLSKKTINSVSWEYLLFETGGVTPVKRYQVRTKVVIPPAEVAELTKDVQPKGNEHQAAVTRIEYSDGSFWQRSDPK
jgi:hypothetical protein